MGCISSKSTTASAQYRYTGRTIPCTETRQQTLEILTCRQFYSSTSSGLGTINSGKYPRDFPTITQQSYPKAPPKPSYGEYRCVCGRTWASRLSWQGNYQVCKRCKRSVHPFKQRELRPSDMAGDKENLERHPEELCQKCQQLGSYCGKRKNVQGSYCGKRQNVQPRRMQCPGRIY